jgi:hypothetical protein
MQNINPKIWGPPMWDSLFYIAFSYPEINPSKIEKENIYNYLISIGEILPCENCRIHFRNNLKENPLTEQILASRKNIILWLLSIKNNISISKQESEMTYDMIINKYMKAKYNYKYEICIFIIFLIILILFFYLKFK